MKSNIQKLPTNRFPKIAPSVEKENTSLLKLFGVHIWNGQLASAIEWLIERAKSKDSTTAGFVNANNLNIAYNSESLRNHYNIECARVFADGSGVKLGAAFNGEKVIENINGTDMLPGLCEASRRNNIRLFFLGAKPGTAEIAAKNLKQSFPGLQICGVHHGYLNDEVTNKRAIKTINDAKPDILLVAMGTPLQEKWLSTNRSKLSSPVAMSVGGLFDFYAGNVSRAPRWIRKLGCEWSWRLLQEPQRMWRRYVLGNPLFMYRVCFELVKSGGDAHTLNKLKQTLNLYKLLNLPSLDNLLLSAKLRFFRMAKRLIDVSVSGLLLGLLMPLFIFVAVALKVDSKGKLLYSQKRVGRGGKLFRFWKFRSMYRDEDLTSDMLSIKNRSKCQVLFKMKTDPRITRVGRIIRRFSIDELPQLWNVLIGDMSLVGPRPCLPSELEKYALSDRLRLAVKPGITCFWQVEGRSELSFYQQMQLDKKYIRSRSLLTDFKILMLTIPAVISGKGAY